VAKEFFIFFDRIENQMHVRSIREKNWTSNGAGRYNFSQVIQLFNYYKATSVCIKRLYYKDNDSCFAIIKFTNGEEVHRLIIKECAK
jgi:hypothetical protein